MGRKRGNNEGSIVKRKDGRWQGAITVGRNSDGSQKRLYVYGKTRTEVSEKINAVLYDINSGLYVDKTQNPTVKEWLNSWLYTYKKNSIKQRTFDQYESIIRVHLNPEIGEYRLVDLKETTLQKFYNRLFKEGLSARSVQLINTVLHGAIKKAIKCGLVVRNVCEAVELPKQQKKERRVLTPDEQKRLLEELKMLRSELAKKENVPAYVIFSNATLQDMVMKEPVTMEEFLKVSGVGKYKAEHYGKAFIAAIQKYKGGVSSAGT